jgi:hypothetical protein
MPVKEEDFFPTIWRFNRFISIHVFGVITVFVGIKFYEFLYLIIIVLLHNVKNTHKIINVFIFISEYCNIDLKAKGLRNRLYDYSLSTCMVILSNHKSIIEETLEEESRK